MKKILFITPFKLHKENMSNAAAANRISLIIRGIAESSDSIIYSCADVSSETKSIFLKSILFILKYISILLKSYKYDFVYIYGEISIPLLKNLSKLFNIKIIVERCEFPNSLISQRKSNILRKIMNYRFLNFLKNIDCFITCSEALKIYYENYTGSQCNTIIVPLIADIKKLESILLNGEDYKDKSIAYCGSMGNNKDGVNILIAAFALIHDKYPDYRLKLIGTASASEMDKLRQSVNELGISLKVDFLGFLSHEKVIKELQKSSILTLARSSNKQAEGGIPSKLAEYLFAGVPTLVTNVGEIYKHVTDGKGCYMCEPDSEVLFAKKLEYIIQNYDDACIIAQNGKKHAELFDYKNQTFSIVNYINDTCEN